MTILAHKLYYMLSMHMLTMCVLCFHLVCYHQSSMFLFIDFISFLYEQETYVVYALILIIMLHTLSIKNY
jgi:hypothetical protein